MKQRLKGPAVALVVAVGAAGGVTVNAMTASEAQAFGLGDVWGAAKKAGSVAKTVGKGAVEVGRGTVRAARGLEDGIGRTVREGAARAYNHGLGEFTSQVSGRLVYGIAKGRHPTRKELDEMRDFVKDKLNTVYDKAENGLAGAKRKARGAIRDTVKDVGGRLVNGKYERAQAPAIQPRPGFDRPVGTTGRKRVVTTKVRSTVGWAIPKVDQPNSTRAPVKGITRQDLGLKKNARRPLGRDKSIWGRPVGQKPSKHGKPLGHDKSIWGRPVGIKPHKGKKPHGKPLGHDKSIWGRPVGVKKKSGRFNSRRGAKQIIRSTRLKAPGRTVQGIARDNLKLSTKGTKTFKSSGSKDRKLRSTRNTRSKFDNRNSRRNKSNRRGRRR